MGREDGRTIIRYPPVDLRPNETASLDSVAFLTAREEREGSTSRCLPPNWVRWLNTVTWTTAPTFVVGDRDEAAALSAERTLGEVEKVIALRNGSFQGVTGKYQTGRVLDVVERLRLLSTRWRAGPVPDGKSCPDVSGGGDT
ncbi:hypothetical protein [Streptomyces sp. NPDC001100]